MIKLVLRLSQPYRFTPCLVEDAGGQGQVLVRPRHLAICEADQRYFRGERHPSVLARKLPMALLHEAVGIVLHDPSGTWKQGQELVLLPFGDPAGDNYRRDAYFRSSTTDGFCQEMLYMNPAECLPIPAGEGKFYVFSELLSVCCHALRRASAHTPGVEPTLHAGIWGDGPVGYMMALAIAALRPAWQISVFGRHEEKLQMFSFANHRYAASGRKRNVTVDIAFECVGGGKAEEALAEITDLINPHGIVTLMGVSESAPRICTRKVLEKGLSLLGTSRSQKIDFETAIKLISEPGAKCRLEGLISDVAKVGQPQDLAEAFLGDRNQMFKTLIDLEL